MNTSKFFSPDEIALIKRNIKAGAMTLDDIRLIVKNELNGIYNTILSSLYGMEITDSPTAINSDSIIYKHIIDDILSCCNIPFWKFHTLIEEGYISVCGSGYTFEKPIQDLTEAEYDRLIYVMWDIGIIIA